MSDQLIDAFDDCTAALMAGVNLDDCVALHPELEKELHPLLLAAAEVRKHLNLVPVPEQAQATSRAKLLTSAIRARESKQPGYKRILIPLFSLTRRAAFGLACLLIGFILGAYAMFQASNRSLPGDLLYGFKRTEEKTRLMFSTNPEKHAILEDQISQRRAQEAQEITRKARSVSIEFGGQLEDMKGDRWVVAGVPVTIPADIQIVGIPDIGLYVWVIGTSQSDQTVKASTIRVEGTRLRGEVIFMSKMVWQVDQADIIVSKSTQYIGNPKIGDQVEVNARILSNGLLLAEEITLISQAPQSTSAPSQSPIFPGPRTPELPKITPSYPLPEATPDPESDDEDEKLDLDIESGELEETLTPNTTRTPEESPDESSLQPTEDEEEDDGEETDDVGYGDEDADDLEGEEVDEE